MINLSTKHIYLTLILFNCLQPNVNAQGTYIPYDPEIYHMVDRIDIRYGSVLNMPHTSTAPYLRSDIGHAAEQLKLSNIKLPKRTASEVQYLMDDNADWLDSLKSKTRNPIWLFKRGAKVALYREPASLGRVEVKDFNLRINPILAFRFAGETASKGLLLVNTRGVDLRFNIKKVVSGYFMFTENQTLPPGYVRSAYSRDSVNPISGETREYVPGETYWKPYDSKIFKIKNGVDYFQARGYINLNVLKYFNITFGHDKNFIGNGYRSMFLSDNSAPYLFLRLNTHIWRINYQNIFCELINQYTRGGDQQLPKKYAAFHHLDIDITKWLNFGFFEGVIMNRSNHFELQYLNPIIFYRSIEQAIGSPDNSVMGIDLKVNMFHHAQFYGQFLLDEFNFKEFTSKKKWWGNKYAIQAGIKYIDIIPNLDGQLEINYARPFTYTHNKEGFGTANYTHYNQALAHPLGANFTEVIFIARYQPMKRLFFSLKYIYSRFGEDTITHFSKTINGITQNTTNYGGNIFQNSGPTTVNNATGSFGTLDSQYGHKDGQGVKASQNYFDLRISYMFWHNVFADVDLLIRNKTSTYKPYSNSTTVFSVGLRMNIGYKEYVY